MAEYEVKDCPQKEEGEESQGRSKRVLRVDQIWSKKDRKYFLVKTRKPWAKNDKSLKWALVVRRLINSFDGTIESVEVEVRSPLLAQVLLLAYEGVPGFNMAENPPTLERAMFFHVAEPLKKRLDLEYQASEPNKLLIEDIETALEFHANEFASEQARLNSLLDSGEIRWDMLWAIFSPHCLIFSSESTLREPQILRCIDNRKRSEGTDNMWYDITADLIHHNGDRLGWSERSFRIAHFNGSKKISSLQVFPLEYHPKQEHIRATISQRSEKFLSLMEPVCQTYEGLATQTSWEGDKWVEKRFHSTGRVMVDPVGFLAQDPDSILADPLMEELSVESLGPDKKLMLSAVILGFSLTEKRWGAFAVSRLSQVDWNEKAFDEVIIPPKKHRIIKVLVKSHLGDKSPFNDIISGKGKGLVGLLTGGPGVGKSLTAEAVAELCRRPLYSITPADLGSEISDVDFRLERALENTRRWGCVLLIDEADVFLQKRSPTQIHINSLVSVFLRRLEYSQGIVILTTNRDQDIDEALKSRIHFKFDYPSLDEPSRFKIWKNFFAGIPADSTHSKLSDQDLESLARLPLNGREIRNTISCAVSIVQATEEPWTLEFVKDIVDSLIEDRGGPSMNLI